MALQAAERKKILESVTKLVSEKHINVANLNQDYSAWMNLVRTRSADLLSGTTDQEFEASMRELLLALGSSHTGFFHESESDIPAPHAIHATLRSMETPTGRQWMFVDVFEDGIAWRAGVRPGESLLAIDNEPVSPPARARFRVGRTYRLEIGAAAAADTRIATVEMPNRLAKDRPPMVEPRPLLHRMISPNIGLLKVATFPGAIGDAFARSLDSAVSELKAQGCNGLIIDLRGNIGGGLGSLRLMSYMCPGKMPIGHSLTRRRLRSGYDKNRLVRIGRIPSNKMDLLLMIVRFRFIQRDRSMVLVTEGLGPQPFHGRIVIITNEFTHSAAEMVAGFAKENRLALLVGTRTAGEVLGGANFRVGAGYRLRMPVAGWFTWQDQLLEGRGVDPDIVVEDAFGEPGETMDRQLGQAIKQLESGERA